MHRSAHIAAAVLLLLSLASVRATYAASPSMLPGMPPEVVSWRSETLARAKYETLADAWRKYLAEHPRSAVAEVQLGRALRYAGAPTDEVRACFARALALDPLCPEALDAAAATYLGEWEPLADGAAGCYELGEQAVALAPDWPDPHFTLYGLALALGRPDEADEHLAALLRKGGIPAPLLDYCHNMLVGAEPQAVVFTNGDNDTFGTLALQVVHGIRPDVLVLNLSLIMQPQIEATIFARLGERSPLPERERRNLRDEFSENFHRDGEMYFIKVIRALAARVAAGACSRPLYLALTVHHEHLEAAAQPRRLEGMLWRLVPGSGGIGRTLDLGTDARGTWALFTDRFRLESATDYAFAWTRNGNVASLMANYVAVLQRVAAAAGEQGDVPVMREAFGRALELASFHGHEGTVAALAAYWRRLDPDNPQIEPWLAPED